MGTTTYHWIYTHNRAKSNLWVGGFFSNRIIIFAFPNFYSTVEPSSCLDFIIQLAYKLISPKVVFLKKNLKILLFGGIANIS